MTEIILASSSPRRKEILELFKVPFSVAVSDLDEKFTDAPPAEQAERLSREKVEALLASRPEFIGETILGADTCLDLDGKMIGKPVNVIEAEEYLKQLSGKTHKVITGLTVYNGGTESWKTGSEETLVRFRKLSSREISWYLGTEEWMGAAGGYRIQEKGSVLSECIEGSWFNVMGLPIRLFYGMLDIREPFLFGS